MADDKNLTIKIGAEDHFSSTFGKLKVAIASAAAAYVSFRTVAAGWDIFKNVAQHSAVFAKLEQNLGLSADLMSRLGFYAEKAGGSIDELSMSLRFMLKNTSEAASGNDSVAKSIEQLGLNVSTLARQSPDEIFKSYVAAFGKVENASDRARLAMEIFGRGGGAMLGVLTKGEEGFKKISAEAERFGLVVSSQEAFNSRAFQQSMKLMELATLGVRKALVDELLPYVTGVFTTLANRTADNRERTVNWARSFVEMMAKATEAIVAFGARAVDTYNFVGAAAAKWSAHDKFSEIQDSFKDLAVIAEKQKKVAEEIAAAEAKGENLNWVVYAEAKRKELAQLGVASEIVKDKIAGLNSEYQALAEAWTTSTDNMFNENAVRKFFNEVRSGMDGLKDLGTPEIPEMKKSPMKTDQSDSVKSEIANLKTLWSGYYESELKQADLWRTQEIAKVKGNKEALALIEQIYSAKRLEVRAKEVESEAAYLKQLESEYLTLYSDVDKNRISELAKVNIWYSEQLEAHGAFEESKAVIDNLYREKKKIAMEQDAEYQQKLKSDELARYANFAGAMSALAAAGGKKLFGISKALAVVQATISTYQGAADALASKIPYPGNIIAAAAVIAYGMAQVAMIVKQKPPQAKKGVDFVPGDQTYMLHKGERVVPAETNKDLRAFLASGGGGMQIGAVSFEFPNIRSAEDLRSMSDREWQDVIETKMIPNMRRLAGAGVKV